MEKAGGFPEDIWVGEDQLLFLRCLMAGAKVVHTPGTMVFYRLGEEGKLTESKDGHARRVTHWAKFLLKANEEVGEKAEHSHDSAAPKGKTNVLPGVGNRSKAEHKLKSEMLNALATRHQLPVTTMPSAWFGFRLRAFEAWRDLESFFPLEENELKRDLQSIWKRSKFSIFNFQFAGFLLRKWGGLIQRLTGSRVKQSFRIGRYTEQEARLYPNLH